MNVLTFQEANGRIRDTLGRFVESLEKADQDFLRECSVAEINEVISPSERRMLLNQGLFLTLAMEFVIVPTEAEKQALVKDFQDISE